MAPSINSGHYVEIETSVRAIDQNLGNFGEGMFLLDFPGGEPMIRAPAGALQWGLSRVL